MSGYGGRSTKDDEDLARRLQHEEEARSGMNRQHQHHNTNHYTSQERRDMELARQFAEMDMQEHRSRGRNTSISHQQQQQQQFHSPRAGGNDYHQQHNYNNPRPGVVSTRNRSSSPVPPSGGGMVDPFDYGSTSPRRYSSSPRKSPGHRRRNTFAAEYDDSFDQFQQQHPHHQRQSRSQSPRAPNSHMRSLSMMNNNNNNPRSPQQRPRFNSDMVQSMHVRTGSNPNSYDNNNNREFMVRGANAYRDPHHHPGRVARSRSTATYGGGGGGGMSSLQEQFRNKGPPITDPDLELARKMQELEDRGMGRMNSEKDIDINKILNDDDSTVDDCGTFASGITSAAKSEQQEKEELAKLISESGMDVSEIPEEVLQELLGTSDAGALNASFSDFKPPPAAAGSGTSANTGGHKKLPDLQALRASLASVDKIEVVHRPDRPDGPAIISARSLKLPSSPTQQSKTTTTAASVTAASKRIPVGGSTGPVTTAQAVPVETKPQTTTHSSPMKQKKKRRGFLSFGSRSSSDENLNENSNVPDDDRKPPPANIPGHGGIPAAIPPPPGGSLSIPVKNAIGHSRSMTPANSIAAGIPDGIPARPPGMQQVNTSFAGQFMGTNVCAACGLTHGTFLKVFNRKYHPDCFRCKSCNGRIDPNDQFKYTVDEHGKRHPHHRECFVTFGVTCVVCKKTIPATPDGRVPYVRHPFFESEEMCVRHTDDHVRRCSGCLRFEPVDNPFIDLIDGERCVCQACCRTVVVDSADAKPLWGKVISFFEKKLKLPIWGSLRDIPVIVVGSESLSQQMQEQGSIHLMTKNPMTSGICLTDYEITGKVSVVGVVCLSGLPRDLCAGVLAHEATHAWLKLHPKYDLDDALPPNVEEGIAQLISMLFISEGLDPIPKNTTTDSSDGPTDEKLRQYFKFTIEREKDEICGDGYRRAISAYRDIGIEALLTHVLQYKDFPQI